MEEEDRRIGFGRGFVAAILIGLMIYFAVLILDNVDAGNWGIVGFGVAVEAFFGLLTYLVIKGD